MAKLKKTTRKSPSAAASNADLQAKAEQLSRGLADSAQQIWLAGVGAFQRAQHEGSKLFDALVKEGSTIETATRKLATGRVDAVRDAVEERVGTVRERAVDTWDRLEKVFEERVQRALTRLGVPSREDLVELTERVDQLTRALKQRGAAPVAKPAAKAPAKAAKKAAAKPAKKAAKKDVKPVKKATTKAAAKPAKARKAALAPIAAPDAPQG
ncbi:phasin family protein [Silanimonas sp.]|jgi:poly(hydroxyalkanoate) granule-associated protein|uniref:phasin family protein n=1 Tax=Silanimonas sp. TaxID=1929290 RepID=UPI0037C52D9C